MDGLHVPGTGQFQFDNLESVNKIMNWKKSLGRRKFYTILLATSVEMIVGILMSLIDTGVAGHIIGVDGLSTMNMVAPITGFTVFTEGLFSVGTALVYATYKGKYQEEKAEAVFGTGLICAIAIGVLTSLTVLCLMPFYLDYMGVSAGIREMVNDFLFYIYPQLALAPVFQLLCQMVFTDGGEITGTAANLTETILNLVLSIILGKKMGILGIGLGTLISTGAALGIVSLHFLSKRNGLRIRLDFDKTSLKKMAFYGANDSAMFFLLPILSFITTKFVIVYFGEYYLPLLTIIYSIFELTVIFEATGEAMRPIMPIYLGDHNRLAARQILMYSTAVNLQRSVLFSLTLLIAGPYIPLAFNIHDPRLLEECITALRIYAIAGPGLAVVANFNSYYINTDKPILAAMESILNGLVCILALSLPLGMAFGIKGMMLGYALAPYLTALILLGYVYTHYPKEQFPDLLPISADVLFHRTILLNEHDIMALVYDVHDFLVKNKIDNTSQKFIELNLEELLLLIKEKNQELKKKKKLPRIYAECCLRLNGKGADLSIWDSGEIFDITEADGDIINFRSYFVERLLAEEKVKKHMVATSFNKNFIHFDIH